MDCSSSQKVKVHSEIKVVYRNALGVFIHKSVMGTVSCQITCFPSRMLLDWQPVRGHLRADRSTYSSAHRPQWVWLVFPGFPHSWLQDWDHENCYQGMTLENPPRCASQWCVWSFHQFTSLSEVKFKDYLNRRINNFPVRWYICFNAVGILSSCEL